jgi:hypothetical protein
MHSLRVWKRRLKEKEKTSRRRRDGRRGKLNGRGKKTVDEN